MSTLNLNIGHTSLRLNHDQTNIDDTSKIIYVLGGLSLIGTFGFFLRMNMYRKEFNFLRSTYTR